MSFEHFPPDVSEHISAFIKHFVNANKQDRWKTLLAMKPSKWVGISAYDCNQPESASWYTDPLHTIQKLGIDSYLHTEAIIFPIGHGADEGWYKGTLHQAIISNDQEVECIVSIIPGKLAVSYGHSNEFRLCKK